KKPITPRAAANKLNERNIESCMGTHWVGEQVMRMALRLGINHPRRLPREVARARVRAMWKQNPEVTGDQVLAGLGREDNALRQSCTPPPSGRACSCRSCRPS